MSPDPRLDLERLLLTAARTKQQPWWKRHAVLTSSIAALAIAAPATAAINGVWSPDGTGSIPTTTRAIAATGGCETNQSPKPATSAAPLPEYLTRAFAVLRTERTGEDRLRLPDDLISDGAVVDAARLLGRNEDGKPYYLVPIISRDRADILPEDCLAQLTPERRRAAETANAKIRSAPAAWKVCVFSPTGGGCNRARSVAEDGSSGQQGISETEPIGEMHSLLPDGVANIRVTYAGNPPRTFPVTRNFAVYRVRLLDRDGQNIGAPTVTWLDARGRTLRTEGP